MTVVILLSTLLAGCGARRAPLGANCDVPADQKGSFMAAVAGFPLAVTADSTFTSEQRAGLAAAVAEWNKASQAVIRTDLFRLGFADVATRLKGMNPRDCSQSFGSDRTIIIVNEQSHAHWSSLNFGANIPGATFRCEQDGVVSRQVVFVFLTVPASPASSDHAATPARPVVDPKQYSSVFLHELGHSIGLDHSCLNDAGRPDFRSCGGLPAAHPYHQATMFPFLRILISGGTPEVKDQLTANDQQRARCAMSPE